MNEQNVLYMYCITVFTLPLFCKKGTTHKIPVLQKKNWSSILHVTDALRGRITITFLGYSCRWCYHLFTYSGLLGE